jgi:hypothetical protein
MRQITFTSAEHAQDDILFALDNLVSAKKALFQSMENFQAKIRIMRTILLDLAFFGVSLVWCFKIETFSTHEIPYHFETNFVVASNFDIQKNFRNMINGVVVPGISLIDSAVSPGSRVKRFLPFWPASQRLRLFNHWAKKFPIWEFIYSDAIRQNRACFGHYH